MSARKVVAVDFFSGIGGFTAGAEATGRVRVALAVNHWPEAVEWHARNHPRAAHSCQDLGELDMTTLPDLRGGILLAAPACQGHTPAGQPARAGTGGNGRVDPARVRSKHARDRNTAWAVVSAADVARPRAIVVENVEAFQRWELFRSWARCLEDLGYAVRFRTLDARAFGSAQHRERTIITASLGDPIEVDPGDLRRAASVESCLDPDGHPANRWSDLREKSPRMLSRMRRAQGEAGRRCLWNNVSESSGRPLDGNFPTVTTRTGSQLYLLDGNRGRLLNPRELARAQSFPDSYELPESRDLAGRLIGNAIDVRMAAAVVGTVVEALLA